MAWKVCSSRLDHWRTFLGQHRLTTSSCPHPQDNKKFGNLLSRWRTRQQLSPSSARQVLVLCYGKVHYSLSTKVGRETRAVMLDKPAVETPGG